MLRKIILFFMGVIFFATYHLAFASLIFTEVMYYPSDSDIKGEWVELYNNGSSDILVKSNKDSYGTSAWRFQKGLIKYYINSPDFTINSGEYIILADDSSLFGSTSYKVIDSSVGLSNTNLTNLAILDENGTSIATLEYTPSGDSQNTGNSLQLISGLWKAASPTPGKENETANMPSSSNNNNNSMQTTTETKPKVIEIPKIKTKIIGKTLAFMGIPIEFSASTTGYSNELLNYGQYFWNFGDGDSKETKANDATKFTHTFFYEGEYVVALEYFQNYYSENPDASDKIVIKVVPADVSISNVGDEKDFFVEISNNTNYDADLSKWILSSNTKSFTLPKNMILGPKKKIILSPKITGFSILDKDTLKLTNLQWETVFDYSASLKPVEVLAKKSVKVSTAISTAVKPPLGGFTAKLDEQIPIDNLEAATINSGVNTKNNLIYGIGLFAFLGASASAAYFIRIRNRKAIVGPTGSDFEIMDE